MLPDSIFHSLPKLSSTILRQNALKMYMHNTFSLFMFNMRLFYLAFLLLLSLCFHHRLCCVFVEVLFLESIHIKKQTIAISTARIHKAKLSICDFFPLFDKSFFVVVKHVHLYYIRLIHLIRVTYLFLFKFIDCIKIQTSFIIFYRTHIE